MYVDKENYFGAGELDLYNPAGSLFKSQLVFLCPVSIPKTDDVSNRSLATTQDFSSILSTNT